MCILELIKVSMCAQLIVLITLKFKVILSWYIPAKLLPALVRVLVLHLLYFISRHASTKVRKLLWKFECFIKLACSLKWLGRHMDHKLVFKRVLFVWAVVMAQFSFILSTAEREREAKSFVVCWLNVFKADKQKWSENRPLLVFWHPLLCLLCQPSLYPLLVC